MPWFARILIILALLVSFSTHGAVHITEFMASNKDSLKDEDGDSPDWIEVFNAGPARVDLTDYGLTDQSTNLYKWRFPKYTLATNEYLIIFASEKNRTITTNQLHTNFKISASKGYLALTDKLTNVVSEFVDYPAQSEDVSYGRDPISLNMVYTQTKPTPGEINATGGPGSVPPVEFSRPGGTFSGSFQLTLQSALKNASIYYTTNTGFPTPTNAFLYTNSILVNTSMVIRARAFADGFAPSELHSEFYIMMSSNLVNWSSDLPVLVIHAMGSTINSSAHRPTYFSLYEPRTGRTSLTNRPTLTSMTGLKTRGSSTGGLAKSSWSAEFWDEYFHASDLSPLGLPPESDWVLYAPNNFDPVLIHNPFAYALSRNSGMYSPRTKFVEVFYVTAKGTLATNNYFGLYVLEEKIKRSDERVNVPKVHTYDNTLPNISGGYLFKIDRTGPGESGLAAGGNTIVMVEPEETILKLPQRLGQWNWLRDYFNAFSKSLLKTNFDDPVRGYNAFIDIDNWIEYHVLEVLSGNVDALVLSSYFHKDRDGRIKYGPHWDFDRALGSTDGRDANPAAWSTGPFFGAAWWTTLLANKDVWQKWVDQYQTWRPTYFTNSYINALIDSLAGEVREAQPRDFAKWRFPVRGGSYQGEVNLMKTWLSNRLAFIDRQITPFPVLSSTGGVVQPGFSVTLSAGTNTVYYTLDGSDPRAASNEIAAAAIEYTGPISIQQNTRLTARARNLNFKQTGGPLSTTPWSSPRAASFVTDPVPLIISEIMYHPARAGSGKTNSGDNFEFVEIKNVGSKPVSLQGVAFTKGISFDFTTGKIEPLPPGGFAVVVGNLSAFTNRFPNVPNIAGQYTGSLDNTGETIVLTGPVKEVIEQVTYDHNWFAITDGLGFSLVPMANSPDGMGWSARASWRQSAKPNGSPGMEDGDPAASPLVVINEVVARGNTAGAVELLNTSGTQADISGWYLTDDPGQPQKFRFAAASTIPASGFRVISETEFNAGKNAFAISPGGGRLYLYAANASGDLSGYFHAFKYGALRQGNSYARFLNASAVEIFEPASGPSLQAKNATAAPVTLIINEIMYHPQPFRTNVEAYIHEFVEIQNITTSSVPLFDASAGASWRVSGGIDFTFPTHAMLLPNQMAILVSFDPEIDRGERNQFVNFYKLSTNALLFGPYEGQLKNGTERLTLGQPVLLAGLNLQDPVSLQYLVADEVTYARTAPWPTDADGTGRSLQRIAPDGFGSDPLNWVSGNPTPGSVNDASDSDHDGLPDWWERAYSIDPGSLGGPGVAAADQDGDGISNLDEYLAGTNPNDGQSYLRITRFVLNTGAPRVTFLGSPGKSYTILYSDDLKGGVWTKLQTVEGPAAQQEVSVDDSTINRPAKRYYRLSSP